MTVTMMKRVKRRIRTVGMMSLMSVQVTPLSSSKVSLLIPERTEPASTWASRSEGFPPSVRESLFLLFDISVRGIELCMVTLGLGLWQDTPFSARVWS